MAGWLNQLFGQQEFDPEHPYQQGGLKPIGAGLLNFGGSLAAASAPSLQPMSFLGNVGKALPSFQEGYYGAQQMGDQDIDRQMKLQEYQDRMKHRKALQALFGGGGDIKPVGGTPLGNQAMPQPADGTQSQGAPMGGTGGGPFDNMDPGMRALIASDPTLADAAVGQYVKSQFNSQDPTNDMQNYKLAQSQGFKGSFMDYKDHLLQSGRASTTINMPRMQNAFQTQVGKGLGDTYLKMNQDAQSSQSKLNKYAQLRNLLGQPNVVQGFAGPEIAQAKNLALSLGLLNEEDAKSLGPTQAAEAISNGLALQLRNPAGGEGMPGSLSNADRDYLNRMVPNLSKVKEGNALLIDYATKVEQRNIDVAKFMNAYASKHGGLDEGFYTALADWSEKNPLFADQPEYSGPANHGSRTTKTGVQWSQPQ